MENPDKLKQSKRIKGKKGDIFFDSIDYDILAVTQNEFVKPSQIADALKISLKNLQPHIMKLVKIGLLDGVLDNNDGQYAFTCYYKRMGGDNQFNFSKDVRGVVDFLNDIHSYIQNEKFENTMNKTFEGIPEIKKTKTK
jgi:DNA replication protein DnaD